MFTSRLDHTQAVGYFTKLYHLSFVKPYLPSVQTNDNKPVNEALNSVLPEEKDFESLLISMNSFSNFDNITVSQQFEKQELIEFHHIAVYLYKGGATVGVSQWTCASRISCTKWVI